MEGIHLKKKVNGKIIEISNLELFEAAFEGLALGRLVSSSVSDTIADDSELINKCISIYDTVYRSLPFPLYAIEQEIKYAMIATSLKNKIDEQLEMWIDSALYIKVEDKKALKFISNTWGIVSVDDKEREDNTDIALYNEDVGYSEFVWALKKVVKDESLEDYYIKFMPEFVKACSKEPLVLKWELSKILDFGAIPERTALKANKIIDIDTGSEFLVDIFSTGKKKTNESEYIINLTGNNSDVTKKAKYIQTYGFEIYEKKKESSDIINSAGINKLKKSNIDGFGGVFETLIGKGIVRESINSVSYTGIIVAGKIVYQVGNQIFICDLNRYTKPVEIGRNVEIYSYDNGFVYIIKRTICESSICKESIYALNPVNMQIKLCKIQFI